VLKIIHRKYLGPGFFCNTGVIYKKIEAGLSGNLIHNSFHPVIIGDVTFEVCDTRGGRRNAVFDFSGTADNIYSSTIFSQYICNRVPDSTASAGNDADASF